MEMLQGVWKQRLRPRAVVGYGVKIFLPSPPNYVTRSPGPSLPGVLFFSKDHNASKYSIMVILVSLCVEHLMKVRKLFHVAILITLKCT